MKKWSLLLPFTFFGINSSFANFVSVPQATQVAVNFYNSQAGKQVSTATLVYTILDNTVTPGTGDTVMYIFNIGTKGFVMVSAEDKATPILGYGTTGAFVTKNMITSIQGWLGEYQSKIISVRHNVATASATVTAQWTALYSNTINASGRGTVGPLCQTTWDQEPYYNALCPEYEGEQCVTGCVATTMGQIMRYWNYPAKGTGSSSYSDLGKTLSADYGTTTYDWGNMPLSLTNSNNDVDTLLYDCGVAVDMQYGTDATGGSGAVVLAADVPGGGACAQTAFITYFGYNPNTILGLKYGNVTNTQWLDTIENELNAGRLVEYAGQDDAGQGGHTWVCDGYETSPSTMFHMNWGWSGQDDGYFAVGDLDVDGYAFNEDDEILIGIEPIQTTGKPVANFTASPTTVCPGSTVSFLDGSSGTPTSWSWTFTGGTPSTSTAQDPSVVYNTPGTYAVTLTVSNISGSNALTKTAYINVLSTINLPVTQGFEGTAFPPVDWQVLNPDNDSITWKRTTAAGGYGTSTASALMDCYDDDGSKYDGAQNILLSSPINFTNVTNAYLKYDYAYAIWADRYPDSLIVIFSLDCGNTFNYLNIQSLNSLTTATPAYDSTTSFVPTSSEWKTDSLSLSFLAGKPSVEIGFMVINEFGQNIYLDNINIDTIPPVAPVANFIGTPTTVAVGGSVNFTDLSTNGPTSWSWSFPGGTPSTSTEQDPTIVYNTVGTYNVTLTATNSAGSNPATKTAYITVVKTAPETCDTLSAVLSTDTLQYYWLGPEYGYFSGNNAADQIGVADSFFTASTMQVTGAKFRFALAEYSSNSTQIMVKVWSASNGVPGAVLDSQALYVHDIDTAEPTIVTFTNPVTVSGEFFVGFEFPYGAGDTVAIKTNSIYYSSDPNHSFVEYEDQGIWVSFTEFWNYIYYYYYGYNIDYNLSDAIYPIICTVPVTAAPVVNFKGTPTTVAAGGTVNFTDESTNSPTSWSWSFPGGTPSTSTVQNPAIVYNTPGTYNVSLTATNSIGSGSLTKTSYITVTSVSSSCDTLANFADNADLVIYTDPDGGYLAGNNADDFTGVAEAYTMPVNSMQLSGVQLYFGVADYSSSAAYVTVTAWDATGIDGSPGNVLASQTLYIDDIQISFSYPPLPTFVNFSNPPSINGNFYVGIQYGYDPDDTVALYTTEIDEYPTNTGWVYLASYGIWAPYDSIFEGAPSLSNAILPILCTVVATPPVADFIGTPTTIPVGGSVDFTDQSSNHPTSWSWSFPGGTPSTSTTENPTDIVYNTAGTYNVTLKATNTGGSDSLTKTNYIIVEYKPQPQFTASKRTVCQGALVNFTDASLYNPTSWNWTFPGGTPASSTLENPTVQYDSVGIYSVSLQATNAVGSVTLTDPSYITVTQAPALNATVTDLSCPGDGSGAIDVTITSGGTPPYAYSWSNHATTEDISGLSAGTYSLTLSDNAGCVDTISEIVTQPFAMILSIVPNPTSCGQSNGSLIISATGGTAPITYKWSNGETGTSLTGLAGATYYVTATDAKGCTKTGSTIVPASSAPSVIVTPTATTCGLSNGAISTSVSGGSGSYTYTWSNGLSTPVMTGLPSGVYSVTVNDGSCTTTGSATVNSSTPISVSTTSIVASCGESNGSATANASGGSGYIYDWDNGQQTATATSLAAGNYTVTVSASGCSATATASVSNVGGPTVSISNVTDVQCYGNSTGSITISVSGGSGNYTYNWSSGSSQASLTGLAANTYAVTVTSGGCISTANATITQPTQLNADAITQSVSCYDGNNGTASALVSGGLWPYSYYWSNTATDSTISGLTAGAYTLTVTDHNNCTTVVTTSVDHPAQLTISVSGTDPGCSLDNGLATAAVFGGVQPYTYIWSNNSTSYLLTGLAAGVYNVIATDANHCTVSGSVTLTTPVGIVLNMSATPSCGGGNSGSATASASDGTAPYTYTWNNNSTDSTITGLASGPYSVTVKDGVGCTASSSVSVGSGLSVQETQQDVTGCYGDENGSISLKVIGGSGTYTFAWSNGHTNDSINYVAGGSYTVTITDTKGGCTTTGNYTVNQPAQLIDSITTTPTVVNGSTGTAATNVTGGTPPYSFNWSNGQLSGSSISGLAAANYAVTVTDADSCKLSSEFTISTSTGIQNVSNDFTFEIYPNPNNGLFQVKLAFKDQSNCTIQVFDELGAIVYSVGKNNLTQDNFAIDLSRASSGTYFVRLVSDDYNVVRKITLLK